MKTGKSLRTKTTQGAAQEASLPPYPRATYAMIATEAPVAAVFTRVGRNLWMTGRWDLRSATFDEGAWFRGTLWPRRSDLSPNGAWLCYFASKSSSRPWPGIHNAGGYRVFSAVSKLPWLFALAACREAGTWGRGFHFTDAAHNEFGAQAGDLKPVLERYGLVRTAPLQYAVERRRGWTEHESCPPRDPKDVWDEERSTILTKPRRDGRIRLMLSDRGYDLDADGRIENRSPAYHLECENGRLSLKEAAWADWDHTGRLLVATNAGQLQIRDVKWPELTVLREHDLNAHTPTPHQAPVWARSW